MSVENQTSIHSFNIPNLAFSVVVTGIPFNLVFVCIITGLFILMT